MSNYYQKIKDEYFCWACDFSKITGEGRLANLFVKKFNTEDKEVKVYTINNFEIKYKLINKIVRYKYILPLVGIFFCWFFFFKKKGLFISITYHYGIFYCLYSYHQEQSLALLPVVRNTIKITNTSCENIFLFYFIN